ncbi:hypothetical protein TNCV_3791211 [Trichonephila clavipes]|nr:hypothetical protein TNCV_3791211 [Trichonephila clavipes]
MNDSNQDMPKTLFVGLTKKRLKPTFRETEASVLCEVAGPLCRGSTIEVLLLALLRSESSPTIYGFGHYGFCNDGIISFQPGVPNPMVA